MSAILDCRWQWISNHFGPMGWFTDAQKAELEDTKSFEDGEWRPLDPGEVTAADRAIAQLAYEQS